MAGDHHREGNSYLQGLCRSLLYKKSERKPNTGKED